VRNTVDAANIPTDSDGNNLPGWYRHYTAVGSDWSRIQIVSVSNPDYHGFEEGGLTVSHDVQGYALGA
jgi:hypothetical protein